MVRDADSVARLAGRPLSSDLSDLVAEARRPKLDELHAAVSGPLPVLELDREPVTPQTWFPEIVRRTVEEVERGEHPSLAPKTLRCSELLLGPGEAAETYEALARRIAVAQLVNLRTTDRPADCAAASVRGDGLRTLQDRETGAVVAFLHTGIFMASAAWSPRGLSGRPVFLPGRAARAKNKPMNPGVAVRLWAENVGFQFVESRRGLEVFRELLREGEVCALPADVLGVANGTLLGRPVRTSRTPAALAKSVGVPLVLVGSFWDEQEFEMRAHTLDPAHHDSIAALHAAMIATMDEWLRDQPEQLLVPFPAAELARTTARMAGDAELARRAEAEAADVVAAAKRRFTELKANKAPAADRAEARSDLLAARGALEDKRRERKLRITALRDLARESNIRFDQPLATTARIRAHMTDASETRIEELVIDTLAGFGPKKSTVTRDATLDELDLDSLDVVELAQALEDALGIEINPEKYDGSVTVGDLIDRSNEIVRETARE